MNPSRDAVETSYRSCRRISGGAGSSFHAGFLLLSPERRRAMEALYAFMRHTDDLADSLQADHLRQDELTAWRAALERAMLGEFDPPGRPSQAGRGHTASPGRYGAAIPHSPRAPLRGD